MREMEVATLLSIGIFAAMETTIGIIIITIINFLSEIIGFVSMVLIITVGLMLMMIVALLLVVILHGIIMV